MARDIKSLPNYTVYIKAIPNHRPLIVAKLCGHISDNICCPDGFTSFLCANSRIFIQNDIPGDKDVKIVMAELIDYQLKLISQYTPCDGEIQLVADRINVIEEEKEGD